MKYTILTLCAIILGSLPVVLRAQDEEPYVLLQNGEKIKPANGRMVAGNDGSVNFTDILGKNHAYSRGQIKFIYSECPDKVTLVEKLFRYQRYEDVIKAVDGLSANEVYLGWGGVAIYLKAMAQVQLGQLDEADTTLKKAAIIVRAEDRENLISGGLKIIQTIKKPGSAPNRVSQLNLVLQGIVYEGEKKYRDSALEYMKVVMLYPIQDKRGTDLERLVAMSRLVNVLKAGNDQGTSGQFAGLMKDEIAE